jgi:hypothetical protein
VHPVGGVVYLGTITIRFELDGDISPIFINLLLVSIVTEPVLYCPAKL